MRINEHDDIIPSQLPELMLHMSRYEGGGGAFSIEQVQQGVELGQRESFVIARLNRLGFEVYA